LYCIELNRPESEFLNSTLAKVIELIDLHIKFKYPDGSGNQKSSEIPAEDFNTVVPGIKAVR